jgi:superfamily II DNA or RNA helicase
MDQSKRERHRVERSRKRKERQRRAAQAAQGAARAYRGWEAADLAHALFREGNTRAALPAAAQAITLAPRDASIAALYVRIAEQSRDPAHRHRAMEHYLEVAEPNVTILIALAGLHLDGGNIARASELLAWAREIFPRRMRERKTWAAVLQRLQARCASMQATAKPAAPGVDQLQLFQKRRGHDEPARAVPPAPAIDTQTTAEPPPTETVTAPSPEEPPLPRRLEIPVSISTAIEGMQTLNSCQFSSLEEVRLATLAAQLRDAESFDHLLALDQARGLLRLSHQEETARKVLSVHLGRALLADEVGLGKTIEAGLVLSEYLLRGRVRRALILTPPSLVGQWREELASKFGIDTQTTERSEVRADPEAFWKAPGVLIASLATVRNPRHKDLAAAQAWDLVIVDEAHNLKNARTQSYALISRLTSRFLLLLTATPIENQVEELYNLVSLLRPGHLGGRAEFLRRFRNRKGEISEAARREIRGLLGEVMIRNTRALSGVQLPPRFARTTLIEPSDSEQRLYLALASALRALGPSGQSRLRLSLLLQEAGSSPDAVRSTLVRLHNDPDLAPETAAALAPAIAAARQPMETAKGQALLRVLQTEPAPTVVFTRFRATLDYLTALLTRHGVACERIDGELPAALRQEAIARCREGGAALLSTDVGSEGLNLQFCQRLVNFDLPWNPMRIEQRIGRVHRIGQDHPVDAVNFCLAGSIEERILCILDERINLFELVVGEVEMILGYLEEERRFPDIVLEAFAQPDAERRDRDFERIGDALAAARARYQNVKAFDENFFRNELGV